jgi:sugar lactone lactonase YvrE
VRTLEADHWLTVGAELGEGPAWDERTRRLSFVDITAGALYRTDGTTVETLVTLDVPLGAALLSEVDDDYLLVTREGFRTLQGGPLLEVLGDRPDLRFNDAQCDPAGRAFAGTLSMRGEPGQGTLFRLDGPQATPVHQGIGLSNGLGWSPDGRTFYFADTDANRVDRFDYRDGELGERQDWVAVSQPDGLCVDADGGVWIALWDGGQVRRHTPDGRLDTVVELPVPHATSCAFAGDLLIVTTGRATRPDGSPSAPLAGDLFAVAPGVPGAPVARWRPV